MLFQHIISDVNLNIICQFNFQTIIYLILNIMKQLAAILTSVLFLQISNSSSAYTVPVGQGGYAFLVSTAVFQCYKSYGQDSVSLFLVLYETGEFSPIEYQNIINAKSAGLNVEVIYLLPRDYPIPIQRQVSKIRDELLRLEFINKDSFWVLPVWDSHQDGTDCEYLKKFLSQLKKIKLEPKIVAQQDIWTQAFMQPTGCPDVSLSELWWWPTNSQQNYQPNFEDYQKIGGWDIPDRKWFYMVEICKNFFLQSYIPDSQLKKIEIIG